MQVLTPELRAGDIVGDGPAYMDIVTRVTVDPWPCVVARVDVIRVIADSPRTVRTHWYAGVGSRQDVYRRGPVTPRLAAIAASAASARSEAER